MRSPKLFKISICMIAMFFCSASYAYGPFVVDQKLTSTPLKWKDNTITVYVDGGDLSPKNVLNAEALKWVTDALNKWAAASIDVVDGTDKKSVKTTALKIGAINLLKGKDIVSCKSKDNTDPNDKRTNLCGDNELDYLDFENYIDQRTAIVFDADGSIIESIGAKENEDYSDSVGLSTPLEADDTGLYITQGIVILNGLMLSNGTLKAEEFQASVLHEVGHLLGLDHSATNLGVATTCTRGGTCEGSAYIPTMFPQILTTAQKNLNYDDVIGISWLYPTKEFTDGFCTVTGKFLDAKGFPLKQINISASRSGEGEDMGSVDTRSFVTGALLPLCKGEAIYQLKGLIPGHSYQISFGPLDESFVEASGFEPLSNYTPPQFDGKAIVSQPENMVVTCDKGGDTITFDNMAADAKNLCGYPADAAIQIDASKSKSGCNLNEPGVFSLSDIMALAVALVGIFAVRRKVTA